MFRPVFAFFILDQTTREILHFNVTRSPRDEWPAQQLREATAGCEGPRLSEGRVASNADAVEVERQV